jgi:hypothetical protein
MTHVRCVCVDRVVFEVCLATLAPDSEHKGDYVCSRNCNESKTLAVCVQSGRVVQYSTLPTNPLSSFSSRQYHTRRLQHATVNINETAAAAAAAAEQYSVCNY